jgi:hypothetical protein
MKPVLRLLSVVLFFSIFKSTSLFAIDLESFDYRLTDICYVVKTQPIESPARYSYSGPEDYNQRQNCMRKRDFTHLLSSETVVFVARCELESHRERAYNCGGEQVHRAWVLRTQVKVTH